MVFGQSGNSAAQKVGDFDLLNHLYKGVWIIFILFNLHIFSGEGRTRKNNQRKGEKRQRNEEKEGRSEKKAISVLEM